MVYSIENVEELYELCSIPHSNHKNAGSYRHADVVSTIYFFKREGSSVLTWTVHDSFFVNSKELLKLSVKFVYASEGYALWTTNSVANEIVGLFEKEYSHIYEQDYKTEKIKIDKNIKSD